MSLQKKVTDFYLRLNNYPTLRFISQDTGMQLTRTFRVLNGEPMRVSEYEIFRNKIRERMGKEGLAHFFTEETWMDFNSSELKEINYLVQKKIKIKKIKENI